MLGQYWPLSLFSQTRMVLRINVKMYNQHNQCTLLCLVLLVQGPLVGQSVYFVLWRSILEMQDLNFNLLIFYLCVRLSCRQKKCKRDVSCKTWHVAVEILHGYIHWRLLTSTVRLDLIPVWESSPNSLHNAWLYTKENWNWQTNIFTKNVLY